MGPGMARRLGRPPKREGPSTRERLLDAALELFARHGYAGTSLRQIAEAVGVRESAIYAHFAGKQAIYDALFVDGGPPSLEALHLDVDGLVEAGPHVAVPDLVDRLFAVWSTPRMRLFASVMLREGSGREGLAGTAQAIEVARGRLQEPFRRWQESGAIRSDVPAGQLVWELVAPLQVPRFLFLRADAGDQDVVTARRWIDDHVRFFLTCVATIEDEGRS